MNYRAPHINSQLIKEKLNLVNSKKRVILNMCLKTKTKKMKLSNRYLELEEKV